MKDGQHFAHGMEQMEKKDNEEMDELMEVKGQEIKTDKTKHKSTHGTKINGKNE